MHEAGFFCYVFIRSIALACVGYRNIEKNFYFLKVSMFFHKSAIKPLFMLNRMEVTVPTLYAKTA